MRERLIKGAKHSIDIEVLPHLLGRRDGQPHQRPPHRGGATRRARAAHVRRLRMPVHVRRLLGLSAQDRRRGARRRRLQGRDAREPGQPRQVAHRRWSGRDQRRHEHRQRVRIRRHRPAPRQRQGGLPRHRRRDRGPVGRGRHRQLLPRLGQARHRGARRAGARGHRGGARVPRGWLEPGAPRRAPHAGRQRRQHARNCVPRRHRIDEVHDPDRERVLRAARGRGEGAHPRCTTRRARAGHHQLDRLDRRGRGDAREPLSERRLPRSGHRGARVEGAPRALEVRVLRRQGEHRRQREHERPLRVSRLGELGHHHRSEVCLEGRHPVRERPSAHPQAHARRKLAKEPRTDRIVDWALFLVSRSF